MEFSIVWQDDKGGEKMSESLQMSVSPICQKEGKKIAYVEFRDCDRLAEGIIPDCTIMSVSGFSQEETRQLEEYMKKNLDKLKKMAAGLNVFEAMKK